MKKSDVVSPKRGSSSLRPAKIALRVARPPFQRKLVTFRPPRSRSTFIFASGRPSILAKYKLARKRMNSMISSGEYDCCKALRSNFPP